MAEQTSDSDIEFILPTESASKFSLLFRELESNPEIEVKQGLIQREKFTVQRVLTILHVYCLISTNTVIYYSFRSASSSEI